MIADAFHCGPDFWGFPSCCNVCHDWADVGDSTADSWDRKQQCYRGACDGVGGKSHWYWCANEHGGTPQQCYIGWAMVPIPVATDCTTLKPCRPRCSKYSAASVALARSRKFHAVSPR